MGTILLLLILSFLIVFREIFSVYAAQHVTSGGVTYSIVETSFGKLKGRLLGPFHGSPKSARVEEYLGVPYGQAPVNDQRFVMPQTTAKWSHLPARDATRFSPVCPQIFPEFWTKNFHDKLALKREALKRMPETFFDQMYNMAGFLTDQNEDCLYLNIYAPNQKDSKKLVPVIVLVHGDSFDWGTGNAFNGSILAAYGQIIVVTLNYRLGVLGFLSSGDPVCKGNWALADLSCALQFLRTIVRDVGGDPHAVTLLGWGRGGAALVNLLMSSPVSAPADSRLFKRAVLLGGTALANWTVVQRPGENFGRLAECVACPTFLSSGDPEKKQLLTLNNITSCIRSRSIDNITMAGQLIEVPSFLTSYGPVIDGIFVNNDPTLILEKYASLFQGLDLMIGLTVNEAFGYLTQKQVDFGVDLPERDALLRTFVRNLFEFHRKETFQAIADQYTDWTDPKFHPNVVRTSVLSALSDGLYAAPAIKLARLHAGPAEHRRGNEETSSLRVSGHTNRRNTFVYLFSHENRALKRGGVQGSVHGEDLAYLLGYPLMDSQWASSARSFYNFLRFDDLDSSISEVFLRYLANFVKFGDPNRSKEDVGGKRSTNDQVMARYDRLFWAPFGTDVRENYLRIGAEPKMEFFYRAPDIAFWNRFLPSLQESGRTEANMDHHLLSNHFVTDSYFGVVLPFSSSKPISPLPPPPPLPTAIPPEVAAKFKENNEKQKTESVERPGSGPGGSGPTDPSVKHGSYSTILSVTVAVGCALLILNVLIFAGIYHQRDKQRKRSAIAKSHAPYRPYEPVPVPETLPSMAQGSMPSPSLGASYNLGSPITPQGARIPLPPPPPLAHQNVGNGGAIAAPSIDGNSRQGATFTDRSTFDSKMSPFVDSRAICMSSVTSHQHQQPRSTHNYTQAAANDSPSLVSLASRRPSLHANNYGEHEPLLSRRAVVSPTCPRHGKQAQLQHQHQQANNGNMAAMEEIQV